MRAILEVGGWTRLVVIGALLMSVRGPGPVLAGNGQAAADNRDIVSRAERKARQLLARLPVTGLVETGHEELALALRYFARAAEGFEDRSRLGTAEAELALRQLKRRARQVDQAVRSSELAFELVPLWKSVSRAIAGLKPARERSERTSADWDHPVKDPWSFGTGE